MSNKMKKSTVKQNSKNSFQTELKVADNKSDIITISVCMIVKDEEKFLDNCLRSVKEIADEIIIIDTGSQDGTVNIAKKYTDKIYFHPWKENFSEARNHYFEYAKGDWIFQIDADEELVKKDIPKLLKAIKNPDIDAIMVQIISTYKKGKDESRHNAERIFRNNGVIHYEGRVHNRLIGIKNPHIYPIGLLHYGYDLENAQLSENKHQRRVTLLKQDIMDDPENPLPYHYLGCCYLPKGLYHETLEVSLKAVKLAEKHNDMNPIYLWSRYNTAMAYYQLKDFNNAELTAKASLKINEYHIDSYFIMTLVNHELKRWDNVITYGQKYIELCEHFKKNPDKFGTLVSSTLGMDWNILVLMGIAFYETGKKEKSDNLFNKASKLSKNSIQVLRAAGLYFYNKGNLQKANEYLKKAHSLSPDDSTIINLLNQVKPNKNKKQTISCCMIVKNEEKYLAKCLSSVKDYVDELIIVDTGSTDNTVEIAKKYTDKIYFHPWENSFSKARNQALGYAKGDWVFQIDGDEELMEGSGDLLRKAVQDALDEDVINVKILCSYANGAKTSMHYFERIFKNNGFIHYEGRVHNRIVGYKNPKYSRIELWHYGYNVDEEKAQEKFERTRDLLLKDIDEDPKNPLSHHYLSCSYLARGMFKEALKEADLAIHLAEITDNRNHIYGWTYYNASFSLFKLGEYKRAQDYPIRALEKYPDHLDSYYMLTIIAGEKSEWDDVVKHGNNFIRVWKDHKNSPEKLDMMIENTMSEAPAIYTLIGHAYHGLKAYNKMEEYYNNAYEASDDKWLILWNIGVYHLDKSFDMERAAHFLIVAAKEAPEEYNAWYMLAKYYNKSRLKDDEIIALQKVIEIGTEDNFIINRLFTLYIEKEQNDKAFELLKSIINPVPSFYPHLLKMGNYYLEKGSFENAFKCYMKAAEVQPDRPEAWSILSEITYSLGKYDDSQIFIEKALKFKGDDVSNLLTMCALKLKSGDIESHVNYLDKLLDCLAIERKRTINGFDDLKKLYIEIGNSRNLIAINSLKLKGIINELDLIMTPAT